MIAPLLQGSTITEFAPKMNTSVLRSTMAVRSSPTEGRDRAIVNFVAESVTPPADLGVFCWDHSPPNCV